MKALKILSLVLALLMVGMVFVACGNSGGDDTTEPENNLPKDPLNVNIIVKTAADGEVKYQSNEHKGYDYIGTVTTPLAILEEFMSAEYDIELTYDENGKLVSVGELTAEGSHLWIWSLAKGTADTSLAEERDENLDDYNKITAGDTIIIYLS